MATHRLTATVYGFVQGVSFRYFAWREAQRLQLNGWVRNERNGTVSLIAEGDPTGVATLRQWLNQGSPAAQVERVEAQISHATGEFEGFRITGW